MCSKDMFFDLSVELSGWKTGKLVSGVLLRNYDVKGGKYKWAIQL